MFQKHVFQELNKSLPYVLKNLENQYYNEIIYYHRLLDYLALVFNKMFSYKQLYTKPAGGILYYPVSF